MDDDEDIMAIFYFIEHTCRVRGIKMENIDKLFIRLSISQRAEQLGCYPNIVTIIKVFLYTIDLFITGKLTVDKTGGEMCITNKNKT